MVTRKTRKPADLFCWLKEFQDGEIQVAEWSFESGTEVGKGGSAPASHNLRYFCKVPFLHFLQLAVNNSKIQNMGSDL